MGFCSLRSFCLTICIIQLLLSASRQVFDFLGYMWGPILANFFQIIFVIFCFFGVYQYRPRYIIAYSVWCIIWCCWNVFVACFYLDLFGLDKDSDLLNLGTGSVSWWESNGPGCKPVFLTNVSSQEAPWRPLRPDFVHDCVVSFDHLEAGQAAMHVLFGVIGLFMSIIISWSLLDEDDSSPNSKKKKPKELPPLYTIEYSIRQTTGDADDLNAHEMQEDPESRLSSPRPMTPRRVKRRSINSRGLPPQRTAAPQMTQYFSPSNTQSQRHTNHARSSTRSSQRRHRSHSNPVTRLIDQQQKLDGNRLVGHTNPMYQQSSTNSLDQDCERPSSARSVYSNYHGTRAFSYMGGPPSTFLSRGPPAYNLHPPDKSETVI